MAHHGVSMTSISHGQSGTLAENTPVSVVVEQINIIDLFRILLQKKLLIILVVFISTGLAVYQALTASLIYRAEVLLEPVSRGKGGGGLSLLNQKFGDLAAMSGLNLGGGSSSTKTAMAMLTSRAFIKQFIQDENLMPILFEKLWDENRKQWKSDDPKLIPSLRIGVKTFLDMFSVTQDDMSGLVVLSLEWKNPEQAAKWTNLLVERINQYIRNLVIHNSKNSITKLEKELSNIQLVELKQVIIYFMEEQMNNIMLATIQSEYVFKVIDPAEVPEIHEIVRPKRRLMVMIGGVVGVFLGIALALMLHFFQSNKDRLLK